MNRSSTFTIALVSLVVLRGESCGEGLVKNSSFALWCGDALCDWRVDSGRIERAPTWDSRELGVALLDDGTALSQTSTTVANCLAFDLLADAQDATLVIEMDFLDDGSFEYSQEITGRHFDPLKYDVKPPSWYDRVRFRVRKKGAGRAVLGRVRVSSDSDCATEPLSLRERPLGAGCTQGSECQSEHCAATVRAPNGVVLHLGRCSACTEDSDCAAGEICAAGPRGRYARPYVCTTTATKAVGDWCGGDRECASGVCCENLCSECCGGDHPSGSCGAGASCAPVSPWSVFPMFQQYECAYGPRATGASCVVDADCASGSCQGVTTEHLCRGVGLECTDNLLCSCWPYAHAGTCS